jgi:hypothetical protein
MTVEIWIRKLPKSPAGFPQNGFLRNFRRRFLPECKTDGKKYNFMTVAAAAAAAA